MPENIVRRSRRGPAILELERRAMAEDSADNNGMLWAELGAEFVGTYLYKRVYLVPAEAGREPEEVRGA